jgi:hypothetical protein
VKRHPKRATPEAQALRAAARAWAVDVTQFPAVRGEPRFGARSVSDEWDVYGELMPTRELAIAALRERMERAR